MGSTVTSGKLLRIGYARARQLLVLTGFVVLAVVVGVLVVRGVDTTEVVATVLFAPIFVALLFYGLPGGIGAAVAASAVYVALRWPVIDAVGSGEFTGLIASRSVAYLLFGAIGGWANGTLESSLDKLDLYDQIDDETGLNNARFLLQDVDLERARAHRYQTVFSVSWAEFPASALASLSGRRRRAVLRELGRKLDEAVRTVDRVAHGSDGTTHRLATILPETGREGAEVFHARFVDNVEDFLAQRGAPTTLAGGVVTVPGDDGSLGAFLEPWRAIDRMEHAAGPPV